MLFIKSNNAFHGAIRAPVHFRGQRHAGDVLDDPIDVHIPRRFCQILIRPEVHSEGALGKLAEVLDGCGVRMPADFDQRPLDVGELSAHPQPVPEVRVVGRPHGLKVAARGNRRVFSVHDGRVGEWADDIPEPFDFRVIFDELEDQHAAFFVKEPDPGANGNHFLMVVHVSDLSCHPVGEHAVVLI